VGIVGTPARRWRAPKKVLMGGLRRSVSARPRRR